MEALFIVILLVSILLSAYGLILAFAGSTAAWRWMSIPIMLAGFSLIAWSIAEIGIHERSRLPVSKQARQGCAIHQGVKNIVAPGEQGAYVICRDGYEFYAHIGHYWR